ncbi:MarR family transcriptional regulator [Streptomyces sp. NPDC048643]|uniref:MarR family winged helix-turn-helix transcriptional regulator n=1 Tax=Streptomyces sp. NPDC048643 TaxID=3155637 RepID=UPI00343070DE
MTDRTPPHITGRDESRTLRALGHLHGELRTRHGLSLLDYLTLGFLAEAAGGSAPVAELKAFLGESGDRISYLLRGMQRLGLVERSRCDRDRRTVRVTLTPAGRARFADVERTANSIVRAHLVAEPATARHVVSAPDDVG